MSIILDYSFDDEGYDIQAPDITFVVDTDVTAIELMDSFRSFMLAIGYADSSIETALEAVHEDNYVSHLNK
jgi:hypothetical protein